MRKINKENILLKKSVVRTTLVSLLSLVIFNIGYAAWVIKAETTSSQTALTVDIDNLEDKEFQFFSFDKRTQYANKSVTSLPYYLSSNKDAGGLYYDDTVGNTGYLIYCLDFDMETFKEHYSWSKIQFDFSLSYPDGTNSLTLLNENMTVSLMEADATKNDGGGTYIPKHTDANIGSTVLTEDSANNSLIVEPATNCIDIYFCLNYQFVVEDCLTEAINIESSTSGILDFTISIKEVS